MKNQGKASMLECIFLIITDIDDYLSDRCIMCTDDVRGGINDVIGGLDDVIGGINDVTGGTDDATDAAIGEQGCGFWPGP